MLTKKAVINKSFMLNSIIFFYTFSLFFLFLPSIKFAGIFYTHSLAKIMILIDFILIFFCKNLSIHKNKELKILVFAYLIFFIPLSLKVIYIKDLLNYLQYYENYLFLILFILNSFFVLGYFKKINLKEKLINFLYIDTINVIIKLLIFASPDLFFNIFSKYLPLNESLLNFIEANLERNRIYYNIIFEPSILIFFFLYLFSKKKINQIIFLLTILIFLFTGLISNYRSNFLLICFSFIFVFIYSAINSKKMLLKTLSLCFFLISIILLLNILDFQNVFYRFNFTKDNIETINFRIKQFNNFLDDLFNNSISIFLTQNEDATDYNFMKFNLINDKSRILFLSSSYVHNHFLFMIKLGGLFSLPLIIFIFVFLMKKFNLIFEKKSRKEKIIVFISYNYVLSLITYFMFNPAESFEIQVRFWYFFTVLTII